MINADEIAGILKNQIESFKTAVQEDEVGTVIEVGANLARVYGLRGVRASELVEFADGMQGVALNLEEDNVGVVILGSDKNIKEGDKVRRTGRIASVPVGEALLGRVVNPLGQPIDGKGPIETNRYRTIENTAPSVVERQGVKQPLQTGIRAIDALIPIGKGQRELIIGDRSTGKTAIAIDTIINQKGANVFCIYVAIGQKNSTVAALSQVLEQKGAMEYTTIIAVSPAEAAALRWLAPFAGAAMGEELMMKGKDVLIVFDDLTKHAQSYREMSLLLRRPPGREAYPGDVFFLHSRLLERAAKLSDELGGGSMTALPIIETQAGDFAAYIPTNVISITDGQIYLTPELFFQGIRPAVDVGLSVSRVGGSAQTKAMKSVAGQLKLELAQYRDLAAFAKLSSDLDKQTQTQLMRGEKMTELLKQPQYQPQKMEDQVALLYGAGKGFVNDVPTVRLQAWAKGFIDFLHEKYASIPEGIASSNQLSDDAKKQLDAALTEFNKSFYMATVRDLRDRIKSLKNTRQITKAMKQVAAAKIRRAEMAQKQARPYAEALAEILRDLLSAVHSVDHPFMKPGKTGAPAGVILMTADKGLAGAFNSNLTRAAELYAREHSDLAYYTVGVKARNFVRRLGKGDRPTWPLTSPSKIDVAREVAQRVTDDFVSGAISEIVLISPKLVSMLSQKPETRKLVPIVAEDLATLGAAADSHAEPKSKGAVEFSPSPEFVLSRLLPKYLEFTIYSAMLETDASFFAAQLIAMNNATDNASKLIDELTIQMNNARQAAITKELLEIVAGAEALGA